VRAEKFAEGDTLVKFQFFIDYSFLIEWVGDNAATVTLSDATGGVLQSVEAQQFTELNLNNYHDGVYFVRVAITDKRAVTKKVVLIR
jgi:Secretion system C-terminal sorting domain